MIIILAFALLRMISFISLSPKIYSSKIWKVLDKIQTLLFKNSTLDRALWKYIVYPGSEIRNWDIGSICRLIVSTHVMSKFKNSYLNWLLTIIVNEWPSWVTLGEKIIFIRCNSWALLARLNKVKKRYFCCNFGEPNWVNRFCQGLCAEVKHSPQDNLYQRQYFIKNLKRKT